MLFSLAKNGLLNFEQAANSAPPEPQHGRQLLVGKHGFFAGSLKFNKLELLGHDKVHVYRGRFILLVVEIQEWFARHQPDAYSRNLSSNWGSWHLSAIYQRAASQLHCDTSSRYRGGSRF